MTGKKILEVFYHGQLVGRLAETPDRLVAFQYDDDWIKNGFSLNPFSLPLDNRVFVPEEKSRERFGGLFGVFADSLPDAWGQLLLERYLGEKGVDTDSVSTLDRLAYVGHSGMGALEYHPSKEKEFGLDAGGLDFDSISEECGKILSSKKSDQLDMLYRMGGSSGGTRPKLFLNKEGRDWIVKFPAKNDPEISGKREYDYYFCAKKCGIVMTDSVLIKSSVCDGYFMTERFDRKGENRIFTETFAGLLEADFRMPACDYATLMKLVRVLTKENVYDKEQLFRIMCFNVMTHNMDDHVKNFSLLFTEEKGWRLAPAYDLTYSDTYWGEHTTSVNRKGKDIKPEDLLKVGTDAGLKKDQCIQCISDITEKTEDLSEYLKKKPGRKKNHIPFEQRIIEYFDDDSMTKKE